MKKIVSVLSFSFFLNFCGGQSFTIINYSLPEGFPSSEVYKVYQDRHGFLWFATDNGVTRYDGHEMQVFHMEHGLSDPAVFGFHEDYAGRLWFRTYSGKLSYYENGKIYKYPYNDQLIKLLPNDLINSIYYDSTGQLWFSSSSILGRIDALGNMQTERMGDNELYYRNVGRNGTLVGIGSFWKGITSISINKKSFLMDKPASITSSPLVCWLKVDNKLYLSFDNSLFEYDGFSIRKVLTGPNRIINISRDREGRIWIGYFNHGAERYHNTDFKDPWTPEFLRGSSVSDVLEDHENGIWITTLEKGVFYIPNFLIENWPLPTPAKIRSVAATDNFVFIGDQQGTVQALSKNNFALQWKKSDPSKQVMALLVDARKNVWVSGFESTIIVDPQLRQTIIPKVGRNNIWGQGTKSSYIAYCSNYPDSIIWAMGGKGLFKYNDKGDLLFARNVNNFCRTILVDDSLIFVGGRTGLSLYDHQFNLIREPKEFSEYKISNILKLNDSTFVFTTIGNGFLVLNKNNWTLKEHNTENKFISNYIYAAAKVDTSLWLGTEKGIVKASIGSLVNNHKPAYHVLTKRSGLVSDKINFILEVHPDTWVFTDAGISIVPGGEALYSKEKAVFYIKNILVNKFPLDLRDKVNLLYDQNNLQIAFGFIAFKNQNILTRYRLKPADPWNYTKLRNLEFYALAPGEYQFELQSSIDNNHWTPVYHSQLITIQPPLWQTWYFQSIVAVLVLLFILIFVVSNIRTYKLHQRKLIKSEIEAIEHERSRIAKELHDSVGTDLTAIKMVVTQRLKKTNDPKTHEVETQFQNTIQDIKSIIYDLSPPGLERYGLLSGLKNYVEKLNDNIPLKIEMKSFGPEIKDHKLSMTVFRIVQELISNSLKHSNAETITLHINAFEDLLNIVYEDNGKGFSWDENHKGLGLYNIESRIQSINGRLTFESGNFGISYFIDIPLNSFKSAG